MPLVTLTTDFGTADGYVGEMKGVLYAGAPGVTVVDIAHDIEPQDVDAARLLVERCWLRFPPATIHIVVVDPGVGTERAAIAVEACDRFLIGPDNGVLSGALAQCGAHVVRLPVPTEASATFHGRDIFAPVAVQLACGVALSSLGEPFASPFVHCDPEPVSLLNGATLGEVVHADRYGNAVTNIRVMVSSGGTVEVAGRTLQLRRTYGDVDPGQPLALVGSSGRVEIAVRNGHATRTLGLTRGARVVFAPPSRR